jgi:cysteinyl-tRNA synthetase
MGTTGTLMGLARRFGELSPSVRVIGVEPFLGHKIQGLKNLQESYRPGVFNKALISGKLNVHDEEAYDLARWLARTEGLLVGMSSGAALAGARAVAAELTEGTVVTIFPDSGERYLSTSLYPS